MKPKKPKWNQKREKGPQLEPQGHQNGAKRVQRGAKSGPKDPNWSHKGAKMRPKGPNMEPKVRPKEAKGDQRGAKKKPKSTKMRPRVGTPKKVENGTPRDLFF